MEGAGWNTIWPTTIGSAHPAWKPSVYGTTVAFEVDDVDATISKLKNAAFFDMEKDRDASLLDGTIPGSRPAINW